MAVGLLPGLLGEVDAARWPDVQGWASPIRAGWVMLSYLCLINECGVRHVLTAAASVSPGSGRSSKHSQIPASKASHFHMKLEIRQMTGEAIKNRITPLLSLSLNMSHAATSDMQMCRHMTQDSQQWKPLPVAWCFDSVFSGRDYWNADRGVWIMDCPTVVQRSTLFLPSSQTATPAVVQTTQPFFFTPERRWQGAKHHECLSDWICAHVFCVGM